MIGCPDEDPVAGRVNEIVSLMGAPNKLFFCGQLGNGLAAKISNNYLSGTFLLAISEAMAIGERSGVDKKVLFDVIQNSSGQSWMMDKMCPVPGVVEGAPSSNDYKSNFPYHLILKDIGLGIDLAGKHGIEPSMAILARDTFEKAGKNPKCEVCAP